MIWKFIGLHLMRVIHVNFISYFSPCQQEFKELKNENTGI